MEESKDADKAPGGVLSSGSIVRRGEGNGVVMLTGAVAVSAAKGYRTLAVARGPETGAPVLVGLVSLYDPPRPDARQLIFAEVFPEDKYIVVKHLQDAGHVTGMTGDGVNDAPALRQAEVGIAVSTATDVAKGAASVVLTEQGLTNIVALVEQGRTIYQRILTWIINKISRTILKAAFVAIAYVVTGKFVISALAMLLLTFLMDFAKITLATDHVRPSKKPET